MTRPAHASSADVAKWKQLAKVAGRLDSRVPLGDLEKATNAARLSVVPAGVVDKHNPFIRLVRTAQKYLAARPSDRDAMADELVELAKACAGQLEPPPDTRPGPGREPGSRLPYADR